MVLRFPRRFLVVLVLLAVAAGSGGAIRGEAPLRQFSSVEAARARFLVRIREMLSEASKMDAAGRSEDAMLVAVRACRMLDALGGESAWPRGEASPAQLVATLAEKHGLSVQQKRPPARPGFRSGEVFQAAAETGPVKPASASSAVGPQADPVEAKRPTAFSRFPKVPAVNRSWVPVGKPVRTAGDWTPVGGAKASATDTISDTQVGPIPVHLTPEIRPAAGIDIRAGEQESQPDSFRQDLVPEQPLEFRPIAEPVPISVETPERQPVLTDSSVETDQPESQSSGGGQTPMKNSAKATEAGASEVAADNSRLLFATLIGAVGGVFLVLAGGFLVRRLDRFSAEPLESRLEETVSPANKATPAKATQGRMVKLTVARSEPTEAAWQPGSSWVEPDSQPVSAVPYPAPPEADSPESPETSPQLQIYHEVLESEATSETHVALATSGSGGDTVARSESTPPVSPAVPFRVIGTSVVLGDAAAAKVDEELQQRRRKIMQAVFDDNLARQSSQNEESNEAA